MRKQIIGVLVLCLLFMHSCQKEVDFVDDGVSLGTLQEDGIGDCLPKTINGIYIATTPLTASNSISVAVNVTELGTYTIASDTVSGFYFRSTGSFTALGVDTITLQGGGTPATSGTHVFTITYGSSTCDIAIDVLPSGSTPAVFALAGAPAVCSSFVVNGSYAVGTPLGVSNTVVLNVNVTTVGAYNISTSKNGMTFSKTGSFTAPGPQTLTLNGSGTPTVNGVNTFSITAGTSTCSFDVTVGSSAVGTLAGSPGGCLPANINGTYTVGTVLTATNTVEVQVNVSTIGAYNITTNTVSGISFSKSGTFTATGNQSVILNGTGTPSAAGAQTFTVTFGSSTCTFTINVVGTTAAGTLGGTPNACTPSSFQGTYTQNVALTATNTLTVQVNVTAVGSYTISTDVVAGFSFSKTGTFSTTGVQTVILNGAGTPNSSGLKTFTVTFGTSTCTAAVTVAAGGGPATGTLGGGPAPAACTPFTVNGTYTVGVALVSGTNTVTVQVNVATIGTYSITTNTVSNFSFSASGTFSTTGIQTVTLNGTGTPAASGAISFIATWGTSTCSFVVNVVAAPAADYYPRTANSNWSFEIDDIAIDSLYRVATNQTITAAGNQFTIFMQDDGFGLDSGGYYRKAGGDYYEWFDAGAFIGYDNPLWAEYIMVKDNVPQGTNWKSQPFAGTIGGQPLIIRFSYTILQKDVPISVTASTGTTTYNNVIVVEEKFEMFNGATWDDITNLVGYFKSYYARNIGLIKFEVFDDTQTLTDWMELRRKVIF
jgi:hypothetical protein